MIQEYLLLDEKEKEKAAAFDAGEATLKLTQIKGNSGWVVSFFMSGENEDSAKKLSETDASFRSAFSVITLENGSSKYMNRRLYPLVADFERKLRKLLYLTSAVHRDETAAKNISALESKDFGVIFSMLFIDSVFMSSVKANINNRQTDFFSKAEVLTYIQSLNENTVWDLLLGKDTVPTLRARFGEVRQYRNDVMHSHNIDWKTFRDAERLYTVINKELDRALAEIADPAGPAADDPSFHHTLRKVIAAQKEPFTDSEVQNRIREIVKTCKEEPSALPIQQKLTEMTGFFKQGPGPVKIQEELEKLNEYLELSKAYQALSEASEKLSKISSRQ